MIASEPIILAAPTVADARVSRQAELAELRQRQIAKRNSLKDSAVLTNSILDWEAKMRATKKSRSTLQKSLA